MIRVLSLSRLVILLVTCVALGLAQGSVYVPLDSWVYPALQRLAALGYIDGQLASMAPWTRAECRRQVQQAARNLNFQETYYVLGSDNSEVHRLISDLEAELGEDERFWEAGIESLYSSTLTTSGTPLRDSYHFGQTIVNNYGRPSDSGFNNYTGFSAYARYGRLTAYLRGEFQQAPGRAANSPAIEQFITNTDQVPPLPSAIAATHKFTPLEAYVGTQVGPEYITFGRESLWWGPGQDSAFAFSNNAAPFAMLRFDQTKALVLPGPLRHLGKIHTQILFGQLSGHHFPAHPYVNAQKITLDLTNDLELSFTRSAFFGGAGRPLTWNSFLESMISTASIDNGSYGQANNPGDRHSGFDFRWRLPGLRRYVTLYSDSYADDDPNPLDNPRRAAWGPGIYLTKLPKLKHVDLRVESYSTWLFRKDYGPNFIYFNAQYRDSYTNDGNLLGSWVGRDARAIVGSLKYWLSGNTSLQAQYKQVKTGNQFLPGGGTQSDASLSGQYAFRGEWLVSAFLQGERYYIPLLGQPRIDITGSLQVTFTPRHWSVGK